MGLDERGAESETFVEHRTMMKINIIGAGAVGQTFGYLFVKHRLATIQGIVNQTEQSAQRAIQFIGQGQCYAAIRDLPHADLTLLTVSDQKIAALARILATNPNLQPGAVVMHCSGALTSACLGSLQDKQCVVASLHPAMSLKNPQWSVQQFMQIPCAVEGDAAAVALITKVFIAIGAMVYQIMPEKKALYHAAAVFSTNYPVTILQQAHACFVEAGLSKAHAKAVLDRFLQTVIENVQQVDEPKFALTGPIMRGDVGTVQQHLQALTDPKLNDLYLRLAKETLELAFLDAAVCDEMNKVLAVSQK